MQTIHPRSRRTLARALALALPMTLALAAPPTLAQGSHQGHAMPGMASGGTEADRALEAAMRRMHDTTPMKGTGRPDHDFVTMMIPHHQGAIDMARVELEHGKDPALKELARSVIADQEKEIATMKEWLAKNPK